MTTKLTLSVKKETIEKAKRLSAKHGKSVSKMVEEYFESLKEPEAKGIVEHMRELMKPYRNRVGKALPEGKSYRDMVRDWKYEEYMKQSAPKPLKKRKAA